MEVEGKEREMEEGGGQVGGEEEGKRTMAKRTVLELQRGGWRSLAYGAIELAVWRGLVWDAYSLSERIGRTIKAVDGMYDGQELRLKLMLTSVP